MQWTTWIGLAVGMVMVASPKVGPPPVMLELGPVVPTPAPTPVAASKKRLITTITVQNSAEGESVISFEATDVADQGDGKIRTLASKNYSLAEEDPKLRDLTGKIVRQIRDLERDMLSYAERAGPPKERAPIGPSESQPGSRQVR
jgi:hypothetical protein